MDVRKCGCDIVLKFRNNRMGIYDTLMNVGDSCLGAHNICMDVRGDYIGI